MQAASTATAGRTICAEIQMAINEVNAKGGVLGRKIT